MRDIILDLCGGTGAWSKPYRDAGYDVRVLTLPEYDVTTVRFVADCVVFGNGDYGRVLVSDVIGILAAPPCTEFSQALNGRRERDIKEGLRIVNACINTIQHCAIYGNLKFWALENPYGQSSDAPLRKFLGEPPWTFEQWQFGGTIQKRTAIWGWYKPPIYTVSQKPEILMDGKPRTHAVDFSTPKCPPEYKAYFDSLPKEARRSGKRAITPAGFAEAFFKANNPLKPRRYTWTSH